MFATEQIKRGGERLLRAIEAAQRRGEQITRLRHMLVIRPLIKEVAQGDDGTLEITVEELGVGRFEVSPGAVCGRQVEEAQPGEVLARVRELPGFEVGFGDLELRGLGQQFVVIESLGRQLQRGVDDGIELLDREPVGAHGPLRPAEIEHQIGYSFVVRELLEEFLVGAGCFGKRALPAEHDGQAEQRLLLVGEGEFGRVQHLPIGDLGCGVVTALRQARTEFQQAVLFFRGVGSRRLGGGFRGRRRRHRDRRFDCGGSRYFVRRRGSGRDDRCRLGLGSWRRGGLGDARVFAGRRADPCGQRNDDDTRNQRTPSDAGGRDWEQTLNHCTR